MVVDASNAGGEADNDKPAGDDSGDKPKQTAPINLDQVHQNIMQTRGEEFTTSPDADQDDDADAEDDADGVDDDPADDGADDSDGADDADADDAEDDKPADKKPTTPQPKAEDKEDLVAPEIGDEDTTKPGKYKSLFVDADGNKHYVTSIDQLPDDFEPNSMKDYGKSIQDLTKKQGAAERDQTEYNAKKADIERQESVAALQQSWSEDIDTLTKSNALPTDAKAREAAIKGTYALMQSEMEKGNVIEKWSTAYELYQAREAKNASIEQKKQENLLKKKNASKIMSGGSGGSSPTTTSSSGRGRVIQAPPPGIGLDRVHQKNMGSL